MSSFNRRSVLLIPLALAACGFTPVYGPQGPAAGLQGTISVASPSDKNSFDLVERLEERLDRPKAVAYDMTYSIATSVAAVGITPDNAITRYNLNGTIKWALIARKSGARVTGGTVHSFTSYSATGSTVAGISAQEDAARRLMRLLADQIVTRMLATSGTWAK
ncbi:MAG: LPS assembly lipoprotein LptE [Cypionkella sp.]